MRPALAIAELEKLKEEAASTDFQYGDLDAWKPRVRAVLSQAFGPTADIVERFNNVSYYPSALFGSIPDSMFVGAFQSG